MGPKRPNSLLVVEDDEVLNHLLVQELRKAGYDVMSASSWAGARSELQRHAPDLVLLDLNLPDSTGFGPLSEISATRPVIMLTAFGDVQQAVQAMRLGASDYLIKPVNLDELEMVIRRTLEGHQLQAKRDWLSARGNHPDQQVMIGDSPAMRQLRQTIQEVAGTDVTVLIQGESGTGKELVAQAIHAGSLRSSEALVSVDCCTLQESLFESEIFGHERGAFTGADRRKTGLIEVASGGTLFFDELGEAGLAIQAKLLRVLETGRIRRLGATTDQRVDVRIVAATNRNLLDCVKQGRFREDLYYRLSTFTIDMPPLRQRTEDIPDLARHFVSLRSQTRGEPPKAISPDAIRAMTGYPWPGNIRELRNVIERALILAGKGAVIECSHLQLQRRAEGPADPMGVPTTEQAGSGDAVLIKGEPTLEVIEREYLRTLLARHRGNRRRVALALGVSERTAYRMLERHGFREVGDSSFGSMEEQPAKPVRSPESEDMPRVPRPHSS